MATGRTAARQMTARRTTARQQHHEVNGRSLSPASPLPASLKLRRSKPTAGKGMNNNGVTTQQGDAVGQATHRARVEDSETHRAKVHNQA
jgi:hypothetical protein